MRRGLAVVVAIVSAVTLVGTPADAGSQGTAQPSVDTTWTKFGENDRLTSHYERGWKTEGRNPVVWVMYDYKSQQESARSGRKYFSQKGQQEMDCDGMRSRTVFFTWHAGHMGNGEVVYTSPRALPWEPNSPGSIARALSAVVCQKR